MRPRPRPPVTAAPPPGSRPRPALWDEPQWREWTARRDPFFGAGSGSRPAGSAGAIVTPAGPELVSVWTAPRARRTGVSDGLVRAVIEWATQAGHRSLRLWVLDGNRPAEQLYLRHGFLPTGASKPCAADAPHPENEMVLPLPAD
ncbi:GNAT family N-acetyltransferase [Nocardia sp. NPDC050193]